MLRLHEDLQALLATAEEKPLIDVAEAERHLALVGIGPQDPVILCAYPSKQRNAYNRYVPAMSGERYDWDQLTLEARSGERDYETLRGHLSNPDKKTPNLGFISCPGGTAIKKRDEIKQGRVLIAEIDEEGLDKEFQAKVWQAAGLPTPTFQMDTGGKSVHHYWVLDQLVSADKIREGRARISKAIEEATGFKPDTSMHSPHQPARLAGGIHPKTGQRSVLINVTGINYSFDEVMAACPELEVKQVVVSSDNLFPDDEGEVPRPGDYPEPGELNCRVPLELALSHKTRQLIKTGQKPGELKGRGLRAWGLSKALRAGKEQLEMLGYQVVGEPLELFDQFCTNSDLLGYRDLETCRQRHFEWGDCGAGELSKSALRRAITKWAKDNNLWTWRPKGFGSGKQSSSKQQTITSGGRKERFKLLALKGRLDLFDRYLRFAICRHKNTFRRIVHLRAVVKELDLGSVIKEKDISERIVKVQQDRLSSGYRAMSAAERMAMERPKVNWLIRDLIPAGDLTFIGGRPKVGKTVAVVDLIRCLLTGEAWIGFEACGSDHTVLLVSDDQSDADTAEMLDRQGLWSHPRLLWSSQFRMDEEQLDRLLDDIRKHPGCVVVVDSLRSITRGMVANENDAGLGVMLYDLKAAVMSAGGSLLMIHHCSKGDEVIGVEALSGHNSIPGAGNTVITLHHLPKTEGRGVQKGIPERRLYREGRSGGATPDVVVTIGPAGRFDKVSEFGEFVDRQAETKRGNKLLKLPPHVQDAFKKLLERYDKDEHGVPTLELLKLAGGCAESVGVKSDLKSDTKFKALERKLNEYAKLGLIQSAKRAGTWSGPSGVLVWSLTKTGATEIRSALA